MFTLKEIQIAHQQVKSGADFPQYVLAIKQLGVTSYESFVADGHVVYHGRDTFSIKSEARYQSLAISNDADVATLQETLRIHQAGLTDYPTFCKQAAQAGVHRWVVDTHKLTCSYFDLANQEILVEKIPA